VYQYYPYAREGEGAREGAGCCGRARAREGIVGKSLTPLDTNGISLVVSPG